MKNIANFNFQNYSPVLVVPASRQTVDDKRNMITQNNNIIQDMRKRLKTETNPKIIARCEEIIEERKDANKRLERDIKIISKNCCSDLCVPAWAQHSK